MNKKEQEKADYERTIFTEFANVANSTVGLGVDIQSIKNESLPKPDISCEISGKRHYFELTEITDQDLARRRSLVLKDMEPRGGFFSQDDPLIKAFSSKSSKRYPTLDGPLELLAYYEKQYPPPSSLIQQKTLSALAVIMQDMTNAYWARLWIYDDWNKRILGCVGNSGS